MSYVISRSHIVNVLYTLMAPIVYLNYTGEKDHEYSEDLIGVFALRVLREELLPINVNETNILNYAGRVVHGLGSRSYPPNLSNFTRLVIPAINRFFLDNASPPGKLTFAFATLLYYYKLSHFENNSNKTDIGDLMARVWSIKGTDYRAYIHMVNILLSFEFQWQQDLTKLSGFSVAVAKQLYGLENHSVTDCLWKTIE